jgi:hypothetical protein
MINLVEVHQHDGVIRGGRPTTSQDAQINVVAWDLSGDSPDQEARRAPNGWL